MRQAWVATTARPDEDATHAQRLATPVEEKESYRWVVAMRQAREASRILKRKWLCCRQRGGHLRSASRRHDRAVLWGMDCQGLPKSGIAG